MATRKHDIQAHTCVYANRPAQKQLPKHSTAQFSKRDHFDEGDPKTYLEGLLQGPTSSFMVMRNQNLVPSTPLDKGWSDMTHR